jgi:hypothetical protein
MFFLIYVLINIAHLWLFLSAYLIFLDRNFYKIILCVFNFEAIFFIHLYFFL